MEQERRGYLRFAAKGHMTDEELAELEEIRMTAEDELALIRGRKENLEELERDRDALLESYAEMTPEGLDALTPEERRQVYGMLRLRVEVAADGTMEAQGILSEDWWPARSDGLSGNGLASQGAPASGFRLSALQHFSFVRPRQLAPSRGRTSEGCAPGPRVRTC